MENFIERLWSIQGSTMTRPPCFTKYRWQ